MNGAPPRHGDRASARDQQHPDAPAPDNSRRAVFSLPSLRGTDTHPAYTQPLTGHAASSGFPGSSLSSSNNASYTIASSHSSAADRAPSHAAPADRLARAGNPAQAARVPSNSNANSQDTNASSVSSNNDSAPSSSAFTPPASASDGGTSGGNGEGANTNSASSQESQLLQLSQLAAAQEKMPVDADMLTSPVGPGSSRKRMADGAVKHTRDSSSASPVFGGVSGGNGGGHSRNPSSVSIASTAGSRIGELSAELKARLSYAMVKVNNGWQSHNIEQVETLASRAASPSSTASTLHGRQGSSASPRLHSASSRGTDSTSPTAGGPAPLPSVHQRRQHHRSGSLASRPYATSAMSPPPRLKPAPSLAPAVSIQPSRSVVHPRRNSNPAFTPTFLSHSGHYASPRTPADASSMNGTPRQTTARTPLVDPILFSPHQNVREQDAIESLLFMSSPGNSANMKHSFPPSSSQPVVSTRTGATASGSQRTALPTGQPRKSLPAGRPPPSSQPTKRVGFDKSPSNLSEMDVDDQYSPHASRGKPRQRTNGDFHAHPRQKMPLSVPSGLSVTSRRRPGLAEADIDKMLDRCMDEESSDSEGEIQIPVRREGPGVVRT
ncbi:hypothetical protein RB593_008508 [Gaeumannomyces tritici]